MNVALCTQVALRRVFGLIFHLRSFFFALFSFTASRYLGTDE